MSIRFPSLCRSLFVCASVGLGLTLGTTLSAQTVKPAAKPATAAPNAKKELSPKEQALLDRQISIHVLNRAAFGPKPGQVTRVFEKGWKKWIEEQLYPEKIDDSALDKRLIEEFPALSMSMGQIWEKYQPGYEAMGMMMGMAPGAGEQKWTEEQRRELMPITRKYHLADLLEACRSYPLRPWERLTFEYVLLGGVNDSDADARRVVRLLASLKAKVNLIALNPGPGIPFTTPAPERVASFQGIVRRAMPCFVRKPRGRDIFAACGQLKRMSEELVTL